MIPPSQGSVNLDRTANMTSKYLLWCALASVVACSESSEPDGSDSELTGTWQLSVWEYSLSGNPSQKADWVSLIDLAGSLTIASSGSFNVTPQLPSGFGTDHGQLTVDADSIYWNGENDEEWVHFSIAGGSLTVTWPEEEFVDMDRDGTPEMALLRVVFLRP